MGGGYRGSFDDPIFLARLLPRHRRWPRARAAPPAFSARIIPIRASIVGPSFVATRIKACIAAYHSGASCSAFGSFVM
jgi:hypothetical protein